MRGLAARHLFCLTAGWLPGPPQRISNTLRYQVGTL